MGGYVRRIQLPQVLRSVRIGTPDDQRSVRAPEKDVEPASVRQEADEATKAARRSVQLAEQRAAEMVAVRELLEGVDEQCRELEQRRAQSLEELQHVAVALASEMASEVLRSEIARNLVPWDKIVAEMIARLENAQGIVVRLNPLDYGLLQTALADLGTWSPPHNVKLNADAAVPRGQCLADGGDFGLSYTLEQHLDEMRTVVREEIRHAQIERRATAGENQNMRRFPDRRETA